MSAKIIALVPAHNEEEQIGATLAALLAQTQPLDRIVVILDNCTDRTAEVCQRYPVEMFETVGNTAKKAGALNQALHLADDYDYILSTDADSICDPSLVERALVQMDDPQIGAVSARAGMKDLEPKHIGQRIVQAILRYQCYLWDTTRMEKPENTTVVIGPGAVFRTSAIKEVHGWDETSLTEDTAISLDLRQAGWKTVLGTGCYAWSDAPLEIKALWRQKVRWSRVYEDTAKRPWSRATASAKLEVLKQWFMFFWLIVWATSLTLSIYFGWFRFNPLWIVLLTIMLVDRLYRLRLFPRVHLADIILSIPLIDLPFCIFWQVTTLTARFQGITKKERFW